MSDEREVRRFLRLLTTDEDFLQEILAADGRQAKQDVIRRRGISPDLTQQDINRELRKLKRTAPPGSPLSKFPLPPEKDGDVEEKVVEWVSAIGTAVGAVATAAAAAF